MRRNCEHIRMCQRDVICCEDNGFHPLLCVVDRARNSQLVLGADHTQDEVISFDVDCYVRRCDGPVKLNQCHVSVERLVLHVPGIRQLLYRR